MDRYITKQGDVDIELLGHGSVVVISEMKVVYIDPYSGAYDYSSSPKADLILITHDHYDHLDPKALNKLIRNDTHIIASESAAQMLENADMEVLKNGQQTQWEHIDITAVPAYNIINMREPGLPFHPKGYGNGYILEVKDLRIYIAGDTEPIPEMHELGHIDIAFLPKNLPYTMSDEMFIEAAQIVRPGILYPYHYSECDRQKLQEQLPFTTIR